MPKLERIFICHFVVLWWTFEVWSQNLDLDNQAQESSSEKHQESNWVESKKVREMVREKKDAKKTNSYPKPHILQ